MSSSIGPDEIDERRPSVSPSQTNKPQNETTAGRLLRGARTSFSESRPPVGMFHAFGNAGSNIPSLNDIQNGSFKPDGWSGPGQRRNSRAHRDSDFDVLLERQQTLKPVPESKPAPGVDEEKKAAVIDDFNGIATPSAPSDTQVLTLAPHDPSVPYDNGYQFPPKHSFGQATVIALRGFWNYFTTPVGFLVIIYALNIVAWGGMLFLILIHATPAMSHPSWNNDYSGAKIWLEIDSQILNALFCVTGLGLIPWRFRDFYYLMQWRWKKDPEGLRRLAGIHRGWFRLEGSQNVDVRFHQDTDPIPAGTDESALAIPVKLSPDPPLTGERASPSKYWKLDYVIWMFVWNTVLQICLCGIMWGLNRFQRPGWTTGFLISLACIVGAAGGWMIFKEGKRVKKVEGVPVSDEDKELLRQMNGRSTV
jgi:hypothetical protein